MQTNKKPVPEKLPFILTPAVLGVKRALKASTSHSHMQPRARTALEK